MSAEDCDVMVNVLMLGDYGVGKTCVMHRFAEDRFLEDATSSTSLDFKVKKFHYKGKEVRINVWDTAGKEKLDSALSYTYYRGANGVILVYDATNIKTFKVLHEWIDKVQKNCFEDTPIILVANKMDLKEKITVDTAEAQKLVDKYDSVIGFYEISTKSGNNVNEIFVKLLMHLVQQNQKSKRRVSNRPLAAVIEDTTDTGHCCVIL